MKSKSCKAKGRRLQQWTCKRISRLTGLEWGKDEQIASRESGQPGTDVRLTGDAADAFPWSCECKYQERWNMPAFIEQARKNRLPGTDWLLVLKRNRQDPVVMMDAEVFFDLLARLPGHKKGR